MTTTYKLKRNSVTIDTYTDPVEAHKAALDLAERTNDAVTVDPDPLHDLADFARDFPVNFKLACGYLGAKLPEYPVYLLTDEGMELVEQSFVFNMINEHLDFCL